MDQTSTNLNLVELYDELIAFALNEFRAYGLYGPDVVFPGTGKTAQDYASEVFLGFVAGRIRTKGNRIAYLCTAVRNDIVDTTRLKSFKVARLDGDGTSRQDGEEKQDLRTLPSGELAPDEAAIKAQVEARTRLLVQHEPELKELVEAVLDLGLVRPAEIADFLGVPVDDIYSRKKKLRVMGVASGMLKVNANG